MSHFAKVVNGIVTDVIKIEQDVVDSGVVGDPSLWIQTSYNTRNGVHINPDTGEPDGGIPLRGNFAGIGYYYDAELDVFYPESAPYPSWVLNAERVQWEPPKPYPTDSTTENPRQYVWIEEELDWEEAPVDPNENQ